MEAMHREPTMMKQLRIASYIIKQDPEATAAAYSRILVPGTESKERIIFGGACLAPVLLQNPGRRPASME